MRPWILGLALATLCFLPGCGKPGIWGEVKENSLAVTKDGEVTLYLVDSFEEEYYNLRELSEMAREEAHAFNTEHASSGEEGPVTVESVELIGDDKEQVLLRERFDSPDTYEAFEEGILFYGTAGEAFEKGFDLEQGLRSAKDGSDLSQEWCGQELERKVLITDLKGILYTPGRVQALSQGVCLSGSTVDTKGTQGNVLLLLK